MTALLYSRAVQQPKGPVIVAAATASWGTSPSGLTEGRLWNHAAKDTRYVTVFISGCRQGCTSYGIRCRDNRPSRQDTIRQSYPLVYLHTFPSEQMTSP